MAAGQRVPGLVDEPAGVDAVRGNVAAGRRGEVGRGEAEVAAAGGTVHHFAAHPVRPASTAAAVATSPARRASRTQVEEQRRSVAGVVVDGEAFRAELADDQHLEAELLAQLLHGGEVAGIAAAEPGVVADHHVAGLQAVDQDRGDEFFRA